MHSLNPFAVDDIGGISYSIRVFIDFFHFFSSGTSIGIRFANII